jgi:hypothetical protein
VQHDKRHVETCVTATAALLANTQRTVHLQRSQRIYDSAWLCGALNHLLSLSPMSWTHAILGGLALVNKIAYAVRLSFVMKMLHSCAVTRNSLGPTYMYVACTVERRYVRNRSLDIVLLFCALRSKKPTTSLISWPLTYFATVARAPQIASHRIVYVFRRTKASQMGSIHTSCSRLTIASATIVLLALNQPTSPRR